MPMNYTMLLLVQVGISLLGKGYSDLNPTSGIDGWCSVGNVRIHSPLIKVELEIHPVAQDIVNGWSDADHLLSACCKCI